MPAPPTEVHIKRKATDDPVDLLHVQNEINGFRQIKEYVFKRRRTSGVPAVNDLTLSNARTFDAPSSAISFTETRNITKTPCLKTFQPGDNFQYRYDHGLGQAERLSEAHVNGTESLQDSVSTSGTAETFSNLSIKQNDEIRSSTRLLASGPRRFHLSRSSTPRSPTNILSSRGKGIKATPAVFIEQRQPTKLACERPKRDENRVVEAQSSHIGPAETRPPTLANASSSPKTQQTPPARLRNVTLPSGDVRPWDADATKYAAEMQAHTLQGISQNLAEASTSAAGPAATTTSIKARQPLSFKPKAPGLRYHERHLEEAIVMNQKEVDPDEEMTDAVDLDEDDSGYVMDTYIRMPAEMFESHEHANIGLLVLDSQPDIDEFYNDDSDSDSDVYDDEEDENAENHPSTDYPDDELESDDEYGCNPYKFYHNRNASDDEEFDLDDATFSDDNEESKPPWARKPCVAGNTFDEENSEEDD